MQREPVAVLADRLQVARSEPGLEGVADQAQVDGALELLLQPLVGGLVAVAAAMANAQVLALDPDPDAVLRAIAAVRGLVG